MKTPKSSEFVSGNLDDGANMSGVMTRSRLRRLSGISTTPVSERKKTSPAKKSLGTPAVSQKSNNARRAVLDSVTESPRKASPTESPRKELVIPKPTESPRKELVTPKPTESPRKASVTPKPTESPRKALVTPKHTSNKNSRNSTLLVTSSNDSVTCGRRNLRKDKPLKSHSNVEQNIERDRSVGVALCNSLENGDGNVINTNVDLCSNIEPIVLLRSVIKTGTKETDGSNSEIDSQLRCIDYGDDPLVSSNNDELSPDQSQKERKIKKSRKCKSSPSEKCEWTIKTLSEHVTEIGNKMNVVKSPQTPDKHKKVGSPIVELSPIRSQEKNIKKSRKSQSSPSEKNEWTIHTESKHVTGTGNEIDVVKSPRTPDKHNEAGSPIIELSSSQSQKEIRIKKTRRSKSSPSEKNEWTIHTVSEHINEIGNEIDDVNSPQKPDKRKTIESLIVNTSALPTEIDECLKSPDNTRSRETQLKTPNDTESTLVDKICKTPKVSDTAVKVPQNVLRNSAEKGHKNEEKFKTHIEMEGDEIFEDIKKITRLGSNEVCAVQSTRTNNILVISPEKVKEQIETNSPVRQGMSSKIHNFSNKSALQDSPASGTKHLENKYEVNSSEYKSQIKKDIKSESSESDSDAESRKAIMESAQKRIIQNISTSESESRKFIKPLAKVRQEDTSDSDSAPEDMSFTAGRQLVMESLKNAVESIQKEKQRRKEKRKQRLEKYKQQKEEKLIRLKEKRASQEDASCSSSEESGYEEVDVPARFGKSNKKQRVKREKENLDDLPQTKVKRLYSDDEAETKDRKEKKRKHEQKDVPQHFGNLRKLPDDVLENLPDQVPLKLQKMDSEATSKEKRRHEKHSKREATDFRNRSDVDYIPLSTCGATEFGVMPLDNLMRAPKSMAEQAAEFRQKMLFGGRIKRGPGNAQKIYQQKLKASGKDRLVR